MMNNVGGIDRVLRILVGAALVALFFVQGSPWFLLGLVPLVTGLVGYCPVYTILGFRTCPMPRHG